MRPIASALTEKLSKALEASQEIPPSLLISATYDGDKGLALLKFYDPSSGKMRLWYDNTGHKPYCYSKLPVDQLVELKGRKDVISLEPVRKLDLLNDAEVTVTKIVATDPLAIGGSPSERSIRNIIEAWEADIKYYENYLYDIGLVPGAYYRIRNNKIEPVEYELSPLVRENLARVLENSDEQLREQLIDWARLLNQPVPRLKRIALDIEVFSPEPTRVPDPKVAEHPVIAASLVDGDRVREVLLLKREGMSRGGEGELDASVDVRFFDDEAELLGAIFDRLLDYPITITFNGDDFDLHYLYNRAQHARIGFTKQQIPISMGKDMATLKHGVHIDLYKTYINRSIQVYAFGNRYTEHTLSGIAEALLKVSKLKIEGGVSNLSLYTLANYCYTDANITYNLTSFSGDLLMKLLMVLCRVAKMPLDDVSRLAVSNWIRSLLYFEHRRINALIPRPDELASKGGASTMAKIKGKKYMGGLVVEPKAGIHFDVVVLDFASLYPSLIKVYNLSYETVRCPHEECKANAIYDTTHWVCNKRRGITSLVIGSLRDLRVNYYKHLAKIQELEPEERELYNVVSQALKVILNASYGVMGADIFPLYCLPVAEATASLGRYVISRTIAKCQELGVEVLYCDTDSLFLKNPSQEQIDTIAKWSARELGVELELEKTFRYVAFSGRKKNYLGVQPDGSVDIKGLTGKKSHTPPFVKETFYSAIEALSQVRSHDDFEKVREAIRAKLRKCYLALRNREIPLEELAFTIVLSKAPRQYTDTTPQHVKAALLLERKGKELKGGDTISFVKTVTPPGVKPLEMAKIEEVDTGKYVEYLRSTFEQLLDALGYDFDEILGATKLEDFFWG